MITSTPSITQGFGSSSEVYNWLSGFTNVEKGQSLRSFRLDRMSALADLAGGPEKSAPSIHVAGSKGKGSVTGMIAAILESSGIRTALYASPHVCDFRERISMGSHFFDEAIYVAAGNELKKLVDYLPRSPVRDLFSIQSGSGEAPSFFELMTLWFFLCAREACCEAMAVETGMGGRLDATNILEPLVSVITLIELEHTEYLGNTIAAIAGEKAGIIKSGRPLILAAQADEALEVFRERAASHNSQLLYFPGCAELGNISVNRRGTSFDLLLGEEMFPRLFVPIPGEVQAYNAGLAVLAVKTAYPGIGYGPIKAGLEAFTLPARFERVSDTPEMVIDGAHTKQSVDLLLKSFLDLYGKDGILIFGCAAGKDVRSMAELCVPFFSRIIITTPGTFKKSDPEMIFRTFSMEAGKVSRKPEILFIPDTREAIGKAINLALEKKLPVLGAGSFYLAGEIKSALKTFH